MFRENWIQFSIIFIITILLIASTGLSQQESAPSPKSLMDVTPAKPLLFVEFSGISDSIKFRESNFWKQIAQAPFWDLFYSELESESKVKDIQLAIEPGMLLLSHLFGQDVVLVMPQFQQITEISPLFMFRFRDDDDLGVILSKGIKIAIANAGESIEQYGGYTIAKIPLKNAPLSLSAALVGNIFAIGLRDATLKKVIDLVNGSEAAMALKKDEDFMSIMNRLSAPEGSASESNLAVFHLNLAKFVALGNMFYAMFSKQIPDERIRPIIGMALKWMDISPSVSSAVTVTDKGIVSQSYTPLNPDANSKNLLAMLQREPEKLSAMKFVPEDAMGYGNSNLIDLNLIWKMIHEFIANIPDAGEQALEGLEGMQEQFGFNLEEDLLSWMGSEFGGVYSEYPAFSKNSIPNKICLILKVTDTEKASQGLEKLTGLAVNLAKDRDVEISIQSEEYMGETIYIFDLPIPIKPGYAIVDDYLLLSPSAEYIKKLIDCAAGRIKGLEASPTFQSIGDRITEKVNSIGYLDVGRYIESAMVSGIKSQGEKFPGWEDANLNLDQVMTLQLTQLVRALSKAFGPSIDITVNDGTGLKSTSLFVLKDLETVVEINDPPVAKIVRNIQIANEYQDAGMLDRALQRYGKVLQMDSENWEALIGTTRILQRQGRSVEAAGYWEQLGFPPESAWYVIGPFGNSDNEGFDTVYPPEEGIDLDAEYESVYGATNWERWADDTPDGFVDFQYMFEPKKWVVSYAWTTVTSKETRQVQLRVGSDDDVKVWLNGEEVLSRKIARAASPDQDVVTFTLNKGENQLLVKVCNREMRWGFYLRFTDLNGKSLQDLEYGR